MKTAIIGATGYGGLELIRLLQNHPYLEVVSLHASSANSEPLFRQYPHLQHILDKNIEDIHTEHIASKAELVFLATPPGVARSIAPRLLAHGMRVIDLSGDFRLRDRHTYETWYKREGGDELHGAVYGLSEWQRDAIAKAQFISNPGCYATATLLAAAPLMKEGLADSLIVDAKSGVSGAGKSPTTMTHFPEIQDNMKIYKVNEHQHIPEIEQMLLEWNEEAKPITFSTHLVPITRGIMVTMYAQSKREVTAHFLQDLYKQSYEESSFVRIREIGIYPSPKEVCGSNYCDIGVTYDERTGRITVVAVIDNLMKGAAGQAVQNANLSLGLDEQVGIRFVPMYP
ncbi:N-acetyl-gamma-glutamyl-phosphate reductase [Ectobacillus antri]|jgi:N-acetyl-gamma-glutamyl-phosphate reductase|uniref:N-acetyl-gamma-glutamyl-phosphate reductase n=1 Tax=Ectobacillus antri TaxID=2486280 RepID=A0ABT6H270_9BACI|nr:N-acetyl-gamma-glutamyl-phosphate reductase [Ectobacillus antri]MDG4655649.1 N-acetyl-gamma-glutamyl-phosphate reductase [Ectobacillus antri]MDG5753407.1 N-acetyl-gamma-glutamyl-phosphate reductase [Ectobacillus antri]